MFPYQSTLTRPPLVISSGESRNPKSVVILDPLLYRKAQSSRNSIYPGEMLCMQSNTLESAQAQGPARDTVFVHKSLQVVKEVLMT